MGITDSRKATGEGRRRPAVGCIRHAIRAAFWRRMNERQKEDLDIIAAVAVTVLLFTLLMILACYGGVFS
jgi:hypothetical protein